MPYSSKKKPSTKQSKSCRLRDRFTKWSVAGVMTIVLGGTVAPAAQVVGAISYEYPDPDSGAAYYGPITVNAGNVNNQTVRLNAVNRAFNDLSIFMGKIPTTDNSGLRIQGISNDPEHELRLDLELAYRQQGFDLVDREYAYFAEQMSDLGNYTQPQFVYLDARMGGRTTSLASYYIRNSDQPVLYVFPSWATEDWAKYDYGRCTNAASYRRLEQGAINMGVGPTLVCMAENRPDGQGIQFYPVYQGKRLEVTAAEDAANDERFWQEHHIDYALNSITDSEVQAALRGLEAEVWRQDEEILELERQIVNAENGYSDADPELLRAERMDLEVYQAEYLTHLNPIRDYFLAANDGDETGEQLTAALEQISWLEEELNLAYEQLFAKEEEMVAQTEEIMALEEEIAQMESNLTEVEAALTAEQELTVEQADKLSALKAEIEQKSVKLEKLKNELAANRDGLAAKETELATRPEPAIIKELIYLGGQSSSDVGAADQETVDAKPDQENRAESTEEAVVAAGNGEYQDAVVEVPELGGASGLPWWFWLGTGAIVTGLGFEVYLYLNRNKKRRAA